MNTVLFDLDDTLLDSFNARIRALESVFSQTKVSRIGAVEFLNSLRGSQLVESLERLAREQNIPDDLFICYRRAYWLEKPGRMRLYPGVKKMLNGLKSKGYKLGIVTNKGRCFEFEGQMVGCVNELEDVGILHLFDTIVGFEDVIDEKPHPEGINLALRNLGTKPRDALMVGDSAADIAAAQAAGCVSCRAAWGVWPWTWWRKKPPRRIMWPPRRGTLSASSMGGSDFAH
ncbi:MAG: HAD-IA family hydrolase [Dehalococcoidales bacterium]